MQSSPRVHMCTGAHVGEFTWRLRSRSPSLMKLSAWLFAVPTIGRSLRIIDRAMEASLSLSLSFSLCILRKESARVRRDSTIAFSAEIQNRSESNGPFKVTRAPPRRDKIHIRACEIARQEYTVAVRYRRPAIECVNDIPRMEARSATQIRESLSSPRDTRA